MVQRLNRELMEILHSEEVRTKLAEGGATAGSAAEFSRCVQKEQLRYAAIVKAANIRD